MRALIFIFFVGISFNLAHSQSPLKISDKGLPPFKVYKSSDYNSSPASWDAIQDNRGIMYFATTGGILEFDGENWKNIDLLWAQNFAKNQEGKIYVGGFGNFGYLSPGETGNVQFFSFKPMLPEDSEVTVVRNIHIIERKVYFVSHDFIYVYEESSNTLSSIQSNDRMYPSYVHDNELIIHLDQKGIHKISGDSLSLTSSGGYWKDQAISNILPSGDNEVVTLSSPSGGHFYSEDSAYQLPVFNHPYYRNNVLFGARRLSNGYYALCFLTGGLVITDREFKPTLLFNKDTGISNQTHGVYEDDQHNLWVTTNDGIIYINLTSQLSYANDVVGIEASVYSTAEYKGEMYTTGHSGIYHKPWNNAFDLLDGKSHRFEKVVNSEIAGIQLINTGDALFSMHNRKKGEIIDNEFVSRLDHKNTYHAAGVLVPSEDVIVTTREEGGTIEVFKKKRNRWEHFKSISDERFSASLFVQIYYDKQYGDFWGMTYDYIATRFRLDNDFGQLIEVEKFKNESGLPEGNCWIIELSEGIYFGTQNGLYRFDRTSNEFIKDDRFGGALDGVGLTHLVKRKKEEYWYREATGQFGKLAFDLKTKEWSLNSEMFAPLNPQNTTTHLGITSDDRLVSGSMTGFIITDPEKSEDFSFRYMPRIRQVDLLNSADSTVFSGVFFNSDSSLSFSQTEGAVWNYEDNALRFRFSVPFFKGVSEINYRYKLEGFDNDWSVWSEKNEKEYTNIPAGEYSFKVEAQNVFGRVSSIASFEFIINPPFYLTYWAYSIYGLFVMLFLWGIVKLNTIRLENDKRRLEGIIAERTDEIRQQAEKLKSLDKAKSKFFANISHELRTPLTLIQGPLELILNGSLGQINEKIKSNLKLSRKNTDKLLNLINEILDLTKLEAEKLTVTNTSINLSQFLHRVFFTYKSLGSEKNIELAFDNQLDRDLKVQSDVNKLEKILDNLLSNAMKFTDEKGKVAMSVMQEKEILKIEVSDTGIGIDEKEVAHVFDRFYQAANQSPNEGGTGIGLSLAKEFSQLLGGDLVVTSKLNSGTIFKLTLPLVQAYTEVEASIQKIENEDEVILEIEEVVGIDRNHQILVVEDHNEMTQYILQTLGTSYNILTAKNGLEALDILESNQVDLVISDIMMPKMDGLQLLAKIKSEERWKYISVIMLTARASDDVKLEALSWGLDDYITKPFIPQELQARVKNTLANHDQRRNWIEKHQDHQVKGQDEPLIKNLITYINENISNSQIGVVELSEIASLSERQLNRLVKRSSGLTPALLIREVRLKASKDHLQSKKFRSVSETAYSVGFEKPSYFTKLFTQRFGKKPSEYLK